MSIKKMLLIGLFAYTACAVVLYFYADKEFITLFFRLLNFAVLVGLALIFYRSMLGPLIADALQKKKLQEDALIIRQNQLIGEEGRLVKEYEKQNELSIYLLEKIKKWKKSYLGQQQYSDQMHEKIRQVAEKKAQQQIEWLEKSRLFTQVRIHTINKMSVDLKEQFSQPEEQKKFLVDILTFMKEQ